MDEPNEHKQQNANTCISCGAVIPEGGWYCSDCIELAKEKENVDG